MRGDLCAGAAMGKKVFKVKKNSKGKSRERPARLWRMGCHWSLHYCVHVYRVTHDTLLHTKTWGVTQQEEAEHVCICAVSSFSSLLPTCYFVCFLKITFSKSMKNTKNIYKQSETFQVSPYMGKLYGVYRVYIYFFKRIVM